MPLTLPTEAASSTKAWATQRFLMLGQPGVGKSTFWSNDPNALFIDTEGNLNHLAVKKVACRSWDDIRDVAGQLYELNAKGKFPYTTLVIDTLDQLLALVEEDTIQWAREKFKSGSDIYTISDIPEGMGWGRASNGLMLALKKFDDLPCALAMIAHGKMTKVKEPTGEYDKETITLWGGAGTKVLGFAHHTMHLQSMYVGETLKRVVRTLPSKGLEAKSHGGRVTDRMEWKTKDLAEEFRAFRQLFD